MGTDPSTTVSTMSTILTNIGSIVTAAIGWMEDYVESIMTSGNELLLIFMIVPLVGLGIGMIKRMISL